MPAKKRHPLESKVRSLLSQIDDAEQEGENLEIEFRDSGDIDADALAELRLRLETALEIVGELERETV